jgi:hypothetical protein
MRLAVMKPALDFQHRKGSDVSKAHAAYIGVGYEFTSQHRKESLPVYN